MPGFHELQNAARKHAEARGLKVTAARRQIKADEVAVSIVRNSARPVGRQIPPIHASGELIIAGVVLDEADDTLITATEDALASFQPDGAFIELDEIQTTPEPIIRSAAANAAETLTVIATYKYSRRFN